MLLLNIKVNGYSSLKQKFSAYSFLATFVMSANKVMQLEQFKKYKSFLIVFVSFIGTFCKKNLVSSDEK